MTDTGDRMREDWDARARENARDYIARGMSDDYMFALSGLQDTNTILSDVHQFLRRDAAVLEIGCGIGRMLRYFSQVFDRVYGVDVSPEMIRQSKEYLADLPNVETFAGDGATLTGIADGSVAFVYSYVVFQHIPDKAAIRSYVHEARRVLEPGGVFKFLVKHAAWAEGEVTDTWYGANVERSDVEAWMAETGFELVNSYSSEATLVWVILRAPGGPREAWARD